MGKLKTKILKVLKLTENDFSFFRRIGSYQQLDLNKTLQVPLFDLLHRNTSTKVSQVMNKLHQSGILVSSIIRKIFFLIYIKVVPYQKVTFSPLLRTQLNTSALHSVNDVAK